MDFLTIFNVSLLTINTGLVLYQFIKIKRQIKKEYYSLIIGKDGVVINKKKILDDDVISFQSKDDKKPRTYILNKDYFYKLHDNKFYCFHNVDDVSPLDITKVNEKNKSFLDPETLKSILENDFVRKTQQAGRSSFDPLTWIKANWIIILIGIVVAYFIFQGMGNGAV